MKAHAKFIIFLFICTLWVGIFFILPDFIDNPISGFKGFLITTFHWGLICFATFFLICLIAVNKYIFSFLFPLLSLTGAVLGFYRYAFKATLTPMIVDAALNNDYGTTMDLISVELVIFVITSLIISVLFVRFRFKKIELTKPYWHLLIALTGLFLLFSFNTRVKASIIQRFPYNIFYSLSEYSKLRSALSQERIDFDPYFSCDNIDNSDSLTIVLVIGESARADHFSLNGYHRKTNFRLEKRNNLISLPNMYSEYTYTNRSIPHMLTRADSVNENLAFTESSFISLFNKCGYRTEWISNQDPADSYIYFMNECDTIIYAHPEKSVYNYNEWIDEDLLPFVGNTMLKKFPKNLFILHTIGSHWYYNNHFTKEFETYKPITRSRIISQNSPEEIINSYDNTIVYTDYFLDKIIEKLEKKNALMIYISDHGEVLGEDGMWLHAGDHTVSKNTACLIWFSDEYATRNPEKTEALNQHKNKKWRTDFLFHSILSAAEIPTAVIKKDMDVFSLKK